MALLVPAKVDITNKWRGRGFPCPLFYCYTLPMIFFFKEVEE